MAPLPPESVALADALGRVLAEDVRSPLTLPPWDNSSMDGYAVRAADVGGASPTSPRELRVVATVAAGMSTDRVVGEGEAIRIMTGGPLPTGADSVIRVEDTDAGAERVRVLGDRDVRKNIRPRGEDLRQGEVAIARGAVLGPGHLGVLASIGRGSVGVHRRPRVALLSSGDELVDLDRFDEVLAGRKIVSSNSYTMAAAVRDAGAEPLSLGMVGDDAALLRERLDRIPGSGCDLAVTTGGVSVGAFDLTRPVLAEMGLVPKFWRLRIRPGAPVGFGMLGSTPWLGLPGNPVSALVTFELLVRPAIRRLLGHARPFRRAVRVRAGESITVSAPLVHFLRAAVTTASGECVARLTGPQGSGLLTSMARADALLIMRPERPSVSQGELLDAILLRGDDWSDEPPGAPPDTASR